MEYKAVKNSSKPGRPPSGCVWVKDDDGNIVTNDKGEVAYRPATAADLKKKKKTASKKTASKKTGSKKTGSKKRGGRKKGATPGRKAVTIGDDQKKAFFLKKTYRDFTATELMKIRDIADSMIDAVKEEERKNLEMEIDRLQNKLQKLD